MRSFKLALASVLALNPANAIGLKGAGSSPTTISAAFVGIADALGFTPPIWYSLQAISLAQATAASQVMVKVINTATSETCDIKVATTGNLGVTANCTGASNGTPFTTFCGATCNIVTRYNIGSLVGANDMAQPTTANQPLLVLNCDGTLPCIRTDRTIPQYTLGTWPATAQPYTLSSVTKRTNAFTSNSDAISNSGFQIGYAAAPNTTLFYAGTGVNTTIAHDTTGDTAFHIFEGTFNSTSSALNADGTDLTGLNVGSGVVNGVVGGTQLARSTGGNNLTGDDLEEGAISLGGTPSSPTDRANACHNQNLRYSLGYSC